MYIQFNFDHENRLGATAVKKKPIITTKSLAVQTLEQIEGYMKLSAISLSQKNKLKYFAKFIVKKCEEKESRISKFFRSIFFIKTEVEILHQKIVKSYDQNFSPESVRQTSLGPSSEITDSLLQVPKYTNAFQENENFPIDLLNLIMNFLRPSDLIPLTMVNKRFKDVAENILNKYFKLIGPQFRTVKAISRRYDTNILKYQYVVPERFLAPRLRYSFLNLLKLTEEDVLDIISQEMFFKPTYWGHTNKICEIIGKNDIKPLNNIDNKLSINLSSLFKDALSGQLIGIIELILKIGFKPDLNSALSHAVQVGDDQISMILVRYGAQLDAALDEEETIGDYQYRVNTNRTYFNLREEELHQSLLQQVIEGNLNVLKEYIEKIQYIGDPRDIARVFRFNINYKDADGNTFFSAAQQYNQLDILAYLKNLQIHLSLLQAVKKGDLDFLKEHIEKTKYIVDPRDTNRIFRFNIDYKDADGNTFFSIAQKYNRSHILEYLKNLPTRLIGA